jgi:hypothetical protein
VKILTNYSHPADDEFDVLCFSGKFHDREYYQNQEMIPFGEILKRLPSGWIPDVVIFRCPEYFPIPAGIEDSPFPTVTLVGDWFAGLDYLPDNLRRFDYIFTDRTTVAILKRMGFDNVEFQPFYGFDPVQYKRLPDLERIYDLTFTGNFNPNVQAARLPWLSRLGRLDPKYKIKLFDNLWGEPYTRVLNQSKIVFNRTVSGAMNMRAFEAPACGALLFMEEENLEIRDFLTPEKECVLYNDKNFEDQVDYYLLQENKRRNIADAGHDKIKNFSYPILFGNLMKIIESKKLQAGCGRQSPMTYFTTTPHRDLIQSAFSVKGIEAVYISRILETGNPSASLLNDCGVLLATFVFGSTDPVPNNDLEKKMEPIIFLFNFADKLLPDYTLCRFNRAQVLFEAHRPEDAYPIYKNIVESTAEPFFERYTGAGYPFSYRYPLRHLWSTCLSETVPYREEMSKARHKVLQFLSCLRLATIAWAKGKPEEAGSYYQKAEGLIPGQPITSSAYVNSFSDEDKSDEYQKALVKTISVSPFEFDVWKRYTNYLFRTGQYDKGKRVIEQCILFLSRLAGDHKELIVDFEFLAQLFQTVA